MRLMKDVDIFVRYKQSLDGEEEIRDDEKLTTLLSIPGNEYIFGTIHPKSLKDNQHFVFMPSLGDEGSEDGGKDDLKFKISVDENGMFWAYHGHPTCMGSDSDGINKVNRKLRSICELLVPGKEVWLFCGFANREHLWMGAKLFILAKEHNYQVMQESKGDNHAKKQCIKNIVLIRGDFVPGQNSLIMKNVFGYLPISDLKQVRQVCKTWDTIAKPLLRKRSKVELNFSACGDYKIDSLQLWRFAQVMKDFKPQNFHLNVISKKNKLSLGAGYRKFCGDIRRYLKKDTDNALNKLTNLTIKTVLP